MSKIFSALEEDIVDGVELITVNPEKEVQEHDSDVVEQLVEINEGMDAVSEAFVAIESMISMSEGFNKAVRKEEGISLKAAVIAKSHTERICRILDYPSKKPIVPALEAFNPQTGLEATKYAVEGINDWINETWEAILRFFQSIKEYIVKLWKGIINANERKKNLIETYTKKLDEMDDNWEPLDNTEAKKRFDNNKNKVLTLQNVFRTGVSDVIEKNVLNILNNQVTISGFDMNKVMGSISIDEKTNKVDVATSTEVLKKMASEIDKNVFIDGWILKDSVKNGKVSFTLEQDVRKKTAVNSMNNKIVSIYDMKLWLEKCSKILENMEETGESYKDYEDALDDVIALIKDNMSNEKGTLSDEDKAKLNKDIDDVKMIKTIVDMVFVKIPSLTTTTVSKTLDLVGFQMTFYKKRD